MIYMFIHAQGINEHVNFKNFGSAFILLLRVATMDNWVPSMQVGVGMSDLGEGVLSTSYE